MSKFLLSPLLIGSAILSTVLAVSTAALAATKNSSVAQASLLTALKVKSQVQASEAAAIAPLKVAQTSVEAPAVAGSSMSTQDSYSQENGELDNDTAIVGQVTSVSQLSDVQPTDWAFQALQSLVERYGCIAGYPDGTFRGNRALTRYEFAAGVNACLDHVNELIAAGTADLLTKEDLLVVQRLQEEFTTDLATLRGRVDTLEVVTATLEEQQFSTTIKLAGEVVFAVTDELNTPFDNNTVLQTRARLALNTSFTGTDKLITRLAAGNAGFFNIGQATDNGTNVEGLQTFNLGAYGGNNDVFADWIAYYFNLNENVRFYIPAVFGFHADHVPTLSPLDTDSGDTGPLSVFAEKNPIYDIGGGSGLAVDIKLTSAITISGDYMADNSPPSGLIAFANNPADKNSLFNGSYSALGQITFQPSPAFGIGFTYVNAYRRLRSNIQQRSHR